MPTCIAEEASATLSELSRGMSQATFLVQVSGKKLDVVRLMRSTAYQAPRAVVFVKILGTSSWATKNKNIYLDDEAVFFFRQVHFRAQS